MPAARHAGGPRTAKRGEVPKQNAGVRKKVSASATEKSKGSGRGRPRKPAPVKPLADKKKPAAKQLVGKKKAAATPTAKEHPAPKKADTAASTSKGVKKKPAAKKPAGSAKSTGLKQPAAKKPAVKKPAPRKLPTKKSQKDGASTSAPQKLAPVRKAAAVAKKPVAQPAKLQRNTTLQTRGKEDATGLRPKSRTTGAPVGAKGPAPKPVRSTPTTNAGVKRSAPAPADGPSPRKRAKSDEVPAAPPPKAPPSIGAAGGGKAGPASPRKDTGKERASTASPRKGAGKAPAASSRADCQMPKSLPIAEIKKFHSYSHQGCRHILKFDVLGDRREKRVPWHEREMKALAEGVVLYQKSWAAILAAKSEEFHRSRTAVDLKDKWRNMMKAELTGKSRNQYSTTASSSSGAPSASSAHGSPSKLPAKVAGPRTNTTHFRTCVDGHKRVPWTKEEVALLEKGVKERGCQWTNILLTYNGFHDCRTTIDLKDKWRNILKQRGKGQ